MKATDRGVPSALTDRGERIPLRDGKLGKRDALRAGHDLAGLEAAGAALDARMKRGAIEQGVDHRRRCPARRLAGDHCAGAAIGAGVVPHMVGVGLPDADVGSAGAEHRRGDLRVHSRGAVAEFGSADGQLVGAVRHEPQPALGMVAARRMVSIIAAAMPRPTSQSPSSS